LGLESSLKPNGQAKSDASLNKILKRFDSELPMTLRDAYRLDPEHPWGDFLNGVNHLISQGLLTGKGDGFVVHYFLTNEGRNAIGRIG